MSDSDSRKLNIVKGSFYEIHHDVWSLYGLKMQDAHFQQELDVL